MAAMSFIVEDGSIIANATSYATVNQYLQYWFNRGVDKASEIVTVPGDPDADPVIEPSIDDSAIKGRLNVATEYIDSMFRWKGECVDADQALKFPRAGIMKPSGLDYYDDDEIPKGVVDAVCYLAAQVKGGELQKAGVGIKSESYGSNSRTYAGTDRNVQYPQLSVLLKGLFITGGSVERVG